MKFLIIIVLFANSPCTKCDIDKVAIAAENIDSLTLGVVTNFLCTFDRSCRNNVEFSEWSNEILFQILKKSPHLFFQAIKKKQVNTELLIDEIENPIADFHFQDIYDVVKITSVSNKAFKAKVLNALVVGAKKSDQNIEP